METKKLYYRVDRREISFLRFILEAYDGIAVLTTVDAQAGIVVIHVPAGCEADVNLIIEDLKQDILIEPAREGKTAQWF